MDFELELQQKAEQSTFIIDCDVHPTLARGIIDLFPYMPKPWQERFVRKRVTGGEVTLAMRFAHPNGHIVRVNSATDTGGVGGSDPKFMVHDLLDAHGIGIGLLNCLQTAGYCGHYASVEESIVLSRAANDFFIDKWLPVDSRFRYAMVVTAQDPSAAAEEIQRVGDHRQISAVALPVIAMLLGDRYWSPIYAAAQEKNLPIQLHVTGADGQFIGAPQPAGGRPNSYIERYVTLTQSAESNLTSLILNGTFERFPGLRVLFTEYGVVWPLGAILRMDRLWRGLRHEVPWVKKPPSEYVNDRVWFTSQPIDEPNDPEDLERLWRMVGIDNICFSTDYPHWDNDMPAASIRHFSAADREKIMSLNARDVLRL